MQEIYSYENNDDIVEITKSDEEVIILHQLAFILGKFSY